MNKFILMWLYMGMVSVAYSQTITIKEQETNQPLYLVVLMSEAPRVNTTTNANGQADISAFKKSDKIEIRMLGYKPLIKSYAQLEASDFEVFLEPYNLNLKEVVVAGTRWSQTSGNVPSKIVSVSLKQLNLQNPQSAADLLSITGKVYVQKSQQGGGSPMIRGFATNRLLYTIDGVRMNTAIYRGGNIQNVINLDPFATEKAEVLFGPGSVIYGSDLARYSSANQEKTGHFDVNLGWKKWAMVSSFSSWDFDHLRQGKNECHGEIYRTKR